MRRNYPEKIKKFLRDWGEEIDYLKSQELSSVPALEREVMEIAVFLRSKQRVIRSLYEEVLREKALVRKKAKRDAFKHSLPEEEVFEEEPLISGDADLFSFMLGFDVDESGI
jgi:hypothetical protein